MTDQKLPEARLVPRDGADRIAILRSHANDGARKAARGTVKACRALTMLAICGAGLAALNAGINTRPRSRALDDLRIESLRPIELPKFDKAEFDRLRLQLERDLFEPRLRELRLRQLQQLDGLELTPEEIHQLDTTWSR